MRWVGRGSLRREHAARTACSSRTSVLISTMWLMAGYLLGLAGMRVSRQGKRPLKTATLAGIEEALPATTARGQRGATSSE